MKHLLQWISLILLGASFLSGCVKSVPPPWASKLSMMREPIGLEEIIRFPDGDSISFAQLLDDLNTTRVIFVGETHDQAEHHQIQVNVLQSLLEKGKDVAVAMEMFESSHQPVLDRWTQGTLLQEEFLKEVQWETTWGMDFNLYKGILNEARNRGLKVLGLNIERDLVRKVAQHGLDGLSQEDKKGIPQMDLTDKSHRQYIASIYEGHQDGSAKDFEKFYQAQCLWDEAMAETLSRFLQSPEGQRKTVLVFAGSGHIVFEFGIPRRLYRRVAIPYKTILLKEWRKRIEKTLEFSQASSPPANFLWITKD